MEKVEKEKQKDNFTKLTQKRGISLIVLIVTIIVIIILAAAVILTITKNNPVSSAKEATFKEDMTSIQDELSMYLSKKYTDDPLSFDKSSVNLSGDSMVTELPSTKKYKDKVSVIKGKLVWNGETENNTEYKWFSEVTGNTSNSETVKEEWKNTIAEVKDGVPIPKGFEYLEGTKETGLVIKDNNNNEFVWIPATEETYVKDVTFSEVSSTVVDELPNMITETYDVRKYGGFYIGRYEAGIPEGESLPSNKVGKPVCQRNAIVWSNIGYENAKKSAELMINNKYVQTGLLTGKAWDTTCNWIKGELNSLTDSRKYGNYYNSMSPADEGSGSKRTAGFSEYWKTKNMYDLAGNLYEWTNEKSSSNDPIARGGCYGDEGDKKPVSWCPGRSIGFVYEYVGFRVRLYIK